MYQQDWSSKWAVYSPNKIAVKEDGTNASLTYFQLHRLCNRLAHHLKDHYNIQYGDRIAVLAENGLEYILLFTAAQKAGFTLVPLNYRYTSNELDYLLQNADPALVITEDTFQLTYQKTAFFKKNISWWSIEALRAFCDPEQTHKNDSFFPVNEVNEDDPIFLLYTSGTTGFPKGALYTHKMLFWNSINTAMSLIINTESSTVNCMPPFHTGGWNVLLTPLLHHGGYICIMKKFDAAKVLERIQSEKATLFMGVPTMLKMMAEETAFEKADFSHLLYMIVGGEPMPIPLIEKWAEKGVPVRQGYGMTEVGPNLTSLHQHDATRKKGSIGRPNFYVSIKIVDSNEKEVSTNQPGELLLKGPMVTPGYWQNEAATNKAIEDNWFHTGDMARQDEEGYLYIVDRIKNMFISGGENVYPAEVERVLVQHEAVSSAAVLGQEDEKWGEVGHAFIVPDPGFTLSELDLKDHCKRHLAKFKVPKYFTFLDQLPLNDAGKVDRKYLRKKFTS